MSALNVILQKNEKVVDFLKLKRLPDTIDYRSIISTNYYENYTGQKRPRNNLGKNILNIGEEHLQTCGKDMETFFNFIAFGSKK